MFREVALVVHRLAGHRVHGLLARRRIQDRLLLVGHVGGLEAIRRLAEPAAGEPGVMGGEVVAVDLLEDLRPQPQQTLVTPDRREQLRIEHGADVVRHVIVHSLGIDDPLAFAEDDVAFHVDLQRRPLVLARPGRKGWAPGRCWSK